MSGGIVERLLVSRSCGVSSPLCRMLRVLAPGGGVAVRALATVTGSRWWQDSCCCRHSSAIIPLPFFNVATRRCAVESSRTLLNVAGHCWNGSSMVALGRHLSSRTKAQGQEVGSEHVLTELASDINRSLHDPGAVDGRRGRVSSLYVPYSKAMLSCSVLRPYLNFDQDFQNITALARDLKSRGLQEPFGVEKLEYLNQGWHQYKNLQAKHELLQSKVSELQKVKSDLCAKELEIDKLKEKDALINSDCDSTVNFDTKPTEVSEVNFKNVMAHNTLNTANVQSYDEGSKQAGALLKQAINKEKENSLVLNALQETVILDLLELPNILDNNTPIDENKVIFSMKNLPKFDFEPKSHVDLGRLNGSIECSDVSPEAIYLKGDLAVLELAIEDYFADIFNDCGYLQHCNPDFAKGVTVEGCGFDIHDTNEVIKITCNEDTKTGVPQFLVGGCSLPSYVGYFAKRSVGKPAKFLPQELYAIGRLYRPLQAVSLSNKYSAERRENISKTTDIDSKGIFSCMQSTAVTAFVAYPKEGISDEDVTSRLLSVLSPAYATIGLHFRIVQKKASELQRFEKAAISIEMRTTSENADALVEVGTYVEVGRISVIGDYISKRLLMCYEKNTTTGQKNPEMEFLNLVYVQAMDITKFIGVMVENTQTAEGKYKIPVVLAPYMLSNVAASLK